MDHFQNNERETGSHRNVVPQTTWTDNRTNTEILLKMETELRLMAVVKERHMKFFGHVMRRENLSVTDMVEGKRSK